ncbi:tripartite tricarboxylate transporter substrate-binding protein [Cupriavidus sp. H18C1]|uniref:tripartite tricarboxylate transporter substrate-binding protein n=1 Tax=Cupriavidus sp. H18C1 TaxID=3241601 RepID=UPI003BB963C6
MAPRLGTSIVVENVGGAGGSIGMQKLARAPADGYTIGFGTIGTHAANMILYRKPLYDARKDFEPLALVGSAPVLLLVKRDLPVNDFNQFADHLRTHHATMSYGSAGVGSIAHLACLMLLGDLKAEVMHVPYKGVAPAMAGLMGGETDFTCDQTTTSLAQVAGGTRARRGGADARALARAAEARPRAGQRQDAHRLPLVERPVCAEGHAARRGGEAEPGDQRRAGRPGADPADARGRRRIPRSRRQHAGQPGAAGRQRDHAAQADSRSQQGAARLSDECRSRDANKASKEPHDTA